ncbi:Ig-like domain-containing protein [Mangrovibacter plantisponsor]|nr:Ig-like domain-containing protein [Mangrovibacter plantisponsor]
MKNYIPPKGMRITAWGLLIFQIVMPLLFTTVSVARAAEYEANDAWMDNTIQGLDSLIDGRGSPQQPPTEAELSVPDNEGARSPATPAGSETNHEAASFWSAPTAGESFSSPPSLSSSPTALPALGSDTQNSTAAPESDATHSEQTENQQSGDAQSNFWASTAVQAGEMLSTEDASQASLDYARSMGEGMINQQINDWLNQWGTAKISLGFDQKISGDFLLPVYEDQNNLFFTQIGLHDNDDRHTYNVGMGYRWYVNDWMYGVNTFYDYDNTGHNARLGVGGEAWTDYLKLGMNGYFRLTNWHQSVLDSMQDYDERPANGFDIRAEGYLPAYPQLGASIKYEKYYGDGIDLGTGTTPDDLKDDPSAVTFGVSYTPVPLLTIKGERATGDEQDTRLSMDVTYRLGTPWRQQIDPAYVDMQRSLMGSRYDIVDRNYDIVMQYRKQDLIRIALPVEVSAEAAETVPLSLTVSRAKYGVKDVEWTASSDFIANGGSFREVSMTDIEVTMPAYVYNNRSAAPQSYTISAVAIDNNDNRSNTAKSTLKVTPSQNIITSLDISPSAKQPANNADYFTIVANVRNEQNAPLVAQPVTFEVDGLVMLDGQPGGTLFTSGGQSNDHALTVNTNSLGQASVRLRSKAANDGTVTATLVNGNYKSGSVSFEADSTTATLADGGLEVVHNNAIADGSEQNIVAATVVDTFENPVPGVAVTFTANHGAVVTSATAVTDDTGTAETGLTNNESGVATVTAAVNGSSDSADTTFKPDLGTAEILPGALVVTKDNAKANGADTNAVKATVTDASGNLVPGVTVNFSADNGATIAATATTNNSGEASTTLTNTKAGATSVSASINGSSQTVSTTFVPDETTAEIADGALVITRDNAVADGTASNEVKATVTDASGNPVSGVTVSFSADHGASIPATADTNASGEASVTLTNTASGATVVTASINSSSQNVTTTFKADDTTAEIIDGALVVTRDNAVANGTATNEVKATVTDASGNPVPNVTVNFGADNGATIPASADTDASGVATVTLTNTTAGATVVTAAINGSSQNVTTTFVPDDTTAEIIDGALSVARDNAKADGSATNEVQATVTDASGNPVPGMTVTFSASNGATIPPSADTDASGVATVTLSNTLSGATVVTASINSSSQDVTTTFVPDDTTAVIVSGALVVTKDGAKADGTDTNEVKATVTDASGNLVPGVTVNFSANNGAAIPPSADTDASGVATVTLTNTAAGTTVVTATINGSSQNVTTTFVPDDTTAEIIDGALVVTRDNAVANGTATNQVKATVTDASGNPVPGLTVTFGADNSGSIQPSADTDASGVATVTLTNTKSGATVVTASINSSSQNVTTTFKADDTTAEIIDGALVVTDDNAVADGSATNAVKATVTDASGNPVPGMTVTFSAGNGATIPPSADTDASGVATVTLTNTTSGATVVTASINSSSQDVTTTFVPDDTTATITDTDFTVASGALANNADSNALNAIVKDANGNVVPGVDVTFSVTSGAATPATQTFPTNSSGVVSGALVSTVAGDNQVTASVNGNTTAAKTSSFVPDGGTAAIADSDFTVTSGAKANGSEANTASATVKDASGNPVPGATVTFTVTDGAAGPTPQSQDTNASGVASVSFTSTVAGDNHVTARVNGSTTSAKVSTFVPDDTTAEIISGALVVTDNGAKADGVDTNAVKATVTDASGNLVPNVTVTFSAGNGATIPPSADTDASGVATVTLTNTKSGATVVTATINGSSQDVTTTFVPDDTTAEIIDGALVVTDNDAKADGVDTNAVKATVTDASGNPVPGVAVTFSASNGATIPPSADTDASGVATVTLTNTKAGATVVTAAINGSSQNVTTTFVPDDTTAEIIDGALVVTDNDAKADGVDTNAVKATVTDASGNPVPGVAVTFSASNGATIPPSADTNASGVATVTLTNTAAGSTVVTATINGSSQDVTTTFVPDDTTAEIIDGALVVTDNDAKADGVDTNAVKATVTDASGNPVPGVAVTFSAGNGATIPPSADTDASGVATVTLTNTKAGGTVVTATINGSSQDVTTTFVPDDTTAEIIDGALVVTDNDAKADGVDTNAVKATVTDASGNPVPGVAVTFSAGNGATIPPSADTDASGVATVTLTNTTSGATVVTATINGSSQDVTTTFVPDDTTAEIIDGALVVTDNDAKADGVDTNAVKATVTDASGNPVPGVAVTFSAGNGATIPPSADTDASGVATVTLTNTTSGATVVTATINGSSQDVTTTFVPDDTTAEIIDGALVVTKDNAKANGTDHNRVKATVTDASGNPVPGVTVTFSADNGATIPPSADTNVLGVAAVTLTNTAAGATVVTATINGSSQDVTTTFVPDDTTAEIIDGALVVTDNDAKADGEDTNAVKATVTDASGNPVPGVTVNFSADNGATIPPTADTNASGEASVTLTNTTSGATVVTAAINGSSQNASTNFMAFTPDDTKSSITATPESIPADNTTTALVQLTLKDELDNAITGRAADITFDVTGVTGTTVGTVAESASEPGVYEATLKGSETGMATVTPKVDGTALSISTQVELVVNWTSLTVTPTSEYVIPGDNLQFTATAVIEGTDVDVSDEVTWSSSSDAVATVSSSGLATGVSAGSANIIATNGAMSSQGSLTVVDPDWSEVFGERRAGDNSKLYQVSSDNMLAFRCGSIVDAMGTPSQGVTGGTGGTARQTSTENVTSVDVEWGNFSYEPGGVTISKLTIHYSDAADFVCGSSGSTSSIQRGSWTVPAGMRFTGFYVYSKAYSHEMQFTATP